MSTSFSTLGVPADIAACLGDLGITEPYPIQTATLPDGLAGRDLFAQSPTGSGKTLAFAIPLVTRIDKARPRRPRGLVLAPTRELAAQIAAAIRPLARCYGKRVAAFYGGTGYKEQFSNLDRGVDIVVGCPGRMIDLLDRGALNLADVQVVVVDEADRMSDMGFLPPVRRLLGEISGPRQTMLFSATLTRDVERLVRDYQQAPKRHVLDLASDEVGSRRHEFWRSARDERVALTAKLVAGYGSSIVFCRTKHGVDRLARHLTQSGLSAVAIHGDRSQSQRDHALARFRDRRAQVLVGTDVASRGLHVEGVDCVIHFDPPEDEDTYVHRSGRTGRAGASGLVVSLVTPDQETRTRQLQRRLGLASPLSPSPKMPDLVVRAHAPSQPVAGRGDTRPERSRRANPRAAAAGSARSRTTGQRNYRQRFVGKKSGTGMRRPAPGAGMKAKAS